MNLPIYNLEQDEDHPDNWGNSSGVFAPLYKCSKHIDVENDEIYPHKFCVACHNDVTPILHDGHPVVHVLTEEELYWESSSPFFEDDDEEEGYNFTCETCGGEFWDGGTSCTCDDE